MKYIVGIDEVGRGPLAGPVSVCVVVCELELYRKLQKNKNLPSKGIDSKKLTAEEREKYSDILKNLSVEEKISYSIQHVSHKIIDSKGLSFCIRKAIAAGVKKLKIA